MAVLNIIAILCSVAILMQDVRERKVYWILFPFLGLSLFLLFYLNAATVQLVLLHVLLNMLIVAIVVLLVYLYTTIFMEGHFLNQNMGLGDLLFFMALAFGFPTVSFMILFVGALVFSLLIFLAMKPIFKGTTVPLAGLMGFFLAIVLVFSLCNVTVSLYAY
jgi:hypothetical protein